MIFATLVTVVTVVAVVVVVGLAVVVAVAVAVGVGVVVVVVVVSAGRRLMGRPVRGCRILTSHFLGNHVENHLT